MPIALLGPEKPALGQTQDELNIEMAKDAASEAGGGETREQRKARIAQWRAEQPYMYGVDDTRHYANSSTIYATPTSDGGLNVVMPSPDDFWANEARHGRGTAEGLLDILYLLVF